MIILEIMKYCNNAYTICIIPGEFKRNQLRVVPTSNCRLPKLIKTNDACRRPRPIYYEGVQFIIVVDT